MIEVTTPTQYAEEIGKLYNEGLPSGDGTGWASLDELYTVAVHYWTIITGIPSHGKSTWMDNLMLNLIRQGWKFVVYSPENQPPALHMAGLVEKALRRPFRDGYHNRLTPPDLARVLSHLENSIRILALDADSHVFPALGDIMDVAHEIINEIWPINKVGLLIDPWNELDHSPIAGMNETQMTNYELMHFRHWVRRHNVHGFVVAHPQKPQRGRDGDLRPVGLYDINGSAAYFNKCDHGIIVRRREDNVTEIDVEKCRFKHLGKKGNTFLHFNFGTGTYEYNIDREQRYRRNDQDGDPF